MLLDRSDDISRLHTGSNKEIKKTALFNWIADCEREGRAMTQQSGADAILQRMSADTDGVASFSDGTYAVATDATTWAFTENFTVGDSVASGDLTVGEVENYSNQTSTAAGTLTFSTTDGGTTYTSTLAGAIDTVGGITVTPGGAGTSAIGQVTTSLTIE